MITKVKLPKADANMNEGTIGKWFVSEGDQISKGEPIVEIITDKTVFEFEAPKSGTLRKIIAPPNSVIPPGYVLALIGNADDEIPEVEEYNHNLMESYLKEKAEHPKIEKAVPAQKASGEQSKGRIRATPSAKRLASEHKLDLVEIQAMFKAEVVNEKAVLDFLERKNISRNNKDI